MSYYVYRYTDLSDGIIKYVGITNNLDKRVAQHSKDDLFKDVLWKIEYFDAENKSTAEAFESHLISVYGTDAYINKAKTKWGVISAFNTVEIRWNPYVKIENSNTVKRRGREKLEKSKGTPNCSLIRYTLCYDVEGVNFEKGYKVSEAMLIRTVSVLLKSSHTIEGPLFRYSRFDFINQCKRAEISPDEVIKAIPYLKFYFWNPDKKYENTTSHIRLFDEKIIKGDKEIVLTFNRWALFNVIDAQYFHSHVSKLVSNLLFPVANKLVAGFHTSYVKAICEYYRNEKHVQRDMDMGIEEFLKELETSIGLCATRIIELDFPKKSDPIFSISQLRMSPSRKVIFELKGDETKSSI